jgi:iron complex outermembrane receptor protein
MRNRITIGALALASITSTCAMAQESGNASQNTAALEEIVVTGSSIRGVTTPGSPVITMDRETLTATGLATGGELARALPQVINLGADESRLSGAQDGAANATRVSSINLRGIGNEATLLLINGRRLAPAGVIKSLYDPNVIPTSAIERMEVVVDGASAIYGSDAVAGVVNIITRKNFTGAETTARYGIADGTDQKIFSQSFGYSWESGSVFGAFEHYERDRLPGRDRDFASADRRARGGSDARSNLASPGNIVSGTTRYPLPNGSGTSIAPASLVAGAPNKFDDGSFPDLLPRQERNSFFLDARQEFGPFTAWYQGWASRRDFDERVSPASGSLRVPNTNAYFVAPAALGNPAFATVEYRFLTEDADPRLTGEENAQQNAVGLIFDAGAGWQIEGYGNLSVNRGFQKRGAITNGAALTAALASSNPATAFNPFGNGSFNLANNPGLVDIIVANRDTSGTSEARDIGLKADGPLFDLPGGSIRVAAGAERHDNEFRQILNATNVIPTGAVDTKRVLNRRHNTSVFGEVFVPIVGSGNAIPGMRSLDLSLALRREDYSDFGTTTDPKYGLTYRPIDSVTLRATYGTSFRAPSLVDTSEQLHNIFIENLPDPTGVGGVTRGIYHNGGRATLSPEEAETWSFGVDWAPDGVLSGLLGSATYYKVDYTNRIDVAPRNGLTSGAVFAPFIARRPAASDVAGNAAFNALVSAFMSDRDLQSPVEPATNINVILDGRRANIGSTRQEGLDLDLSYRFDTSYGNWSAGVNVAKILDLTRSSAPSLPFIDVLDTFGNPVDLRARASLGWRLGGFAANAFVNYVDGYRNTAINPNVSVDSYHTVDASLSYEIGDGILEGLNVALNAQDLFDEEPPVVLNGIYSWDNQNVSPLGRLVSVVVTMKW